MNGWGLENIVKRISKHIDNVISICFFYIKKNFFYVVKPPDGCYDRDIDRK